jgi:hypothetical protein
MGNSQTDGSGHAMGAHTKSQVALEKPLKGRPEALTPELRNPM